MTDTIKTTNNETIHIGDWIEAGKGNDRDRGQVVDIDGNDITVAWVGGACRTKQDIAALDDLEFSYPGPHRS
jgi:hypothetical protein